MFVNPKGIIDPQITHIDEKEPVNIYYISKKKKTEAINEIAQIIEERSYVF